MAIKERDSSKFISYLFKSSSRPRFLETLARATMARRPTCGPLASSCMPCWQGTSHSVSAVGRDACVCTVRVCATVCVPVCECLGRYSPASTSYGPGERSRRVFLYATIHVDTCAAGCCGAPVRSDDSTADGRPASIAPNDKTLTPNAPHVASHPSSSSQARTSSTAPASTSFPAG